MWGAPRGRGRGFANRSLVRNAPAAAPSSSTPEGFVRRGNSLINVSALAAPPAAPRPPPPAPQPPPVVAHPPLAAPPAAQLKYSFHQPARGRGGSGRGRRSPHYASPAWRPRGNAAHLRGALRGGGSLLSRALHHNRTLRRAPAAAPLASKIGKERAQVDHLVGGVRYRRAGRGGRSLLRVSAGGGDAAKRPHVQYVRSANGMALVRQQRAPAVKDLLSRPPSVRPLLPGQRKAKDCFMWTKTGKCNHIATCRSPPPQCVALTTLRRHRHDPERVAVCRKFLLGECRDEQCALQHRLSARDQTMPVCSFFLRGLCANERCLYAHVKVNPDAQVCQAFQEGFCAAGATCTKLHTNVCQDFKATGKCPRGAKCKLKHPLGKRRRRDAQGAVAMKVKQRGEAARGDGESVHIGAEAGAGAAGAGAGEAGAPPSLLSGSILPSFAAADDSLLSAPL